MRLSLLALLFITLLSHAGKDEKALAHAPLIKAIEFLERQPFNEKDTGKISEILERHGQALVESPMGTEALLKFWQRTSGHDPEKIAALRVGEFLAKQIRHSSKIQERFVDEILRSFDTAANSIIGRKRAIFAAASLHEAMATNVSLRNNFLGQINYLQHQSTNFRDLEIALSTLDLALNQDRSVRKRLIDLGLRASSSNRLIVYEQLIPFVSKDPEVKEFLLNEFRPVLDDNIVDYKRIEKLFDPLLEKAPEKMIDVFLSSKERRTRFPQLFISVAYRASKVKYRTSEFRESLFDIMKQPKDYNQIALQAAGAALLPEVRDNAEFRKRLLEVYGKSVHENQQVGILQALTGSLFDKDVLPLFIEIVTYRGRFSEHNSAEISEIMQHAASENKHLRQLILDELKITDLDWTNLARLLSYIHGDITGDQGKLLPFLQHPSSTIRAQALAKFKYAKTYNEKAQKEFARLLRSQDASDVEGALVVLQKAQIQMQTNDVDASDPYRGVGKPIAASETLTSILGYEDVEKNLLVLAVDTDLERADIAKSARLILQRDPGLSEASREKLAACGQSRFKKIFNWLGAKKP